ncbi:hypothetical protein [Robertkochia solimangrovi]|uniref:hypothetical protein n=1 Tax=Robertkochia solimangrovi TaxID=2213046 RepID=UPI001F549AA3|nr:hypothetical protein [Robertkochia solimangrovi]
MGIIVLIAFNIQLRDKQEEEFLYEMSFDEELLEEPEELQEEAKMTELETHMAYNEAAAENKYTKEIEDFKTLEEIKQELADRQAEDSGEELNELSENMGLAKEYTERLKKQKEMLEKNQAKEEEDKPVNIKRRTTISYSMVNRNHLDLPNPIYTCESFGKVVINITIDSKGKVIDASFNEHSSTTSNGCLVENAIYYAERSRFNADLSKPEQIGSITYLFQGE